MHVILMIPLFYFIMRLYWERQSKINHCGHPCTYLCSKYFTNHDELYIMIDLKKERIIVSSNTNQVQNSPEYLGTKDLEINKSLI